MNGVLQVSSSIEDTRVYKRFKDFRWCPDMHSTQHVWDIQDLSTGLQCRITVRSNVIYPLTALVFLCVVQLFICQNV